MNPETSAPPTPLHMPVPTGDQLKAARMASAVETAAESDISLRLNELAGVIDVVLASLSARLIRLAA